MKHKALLIALWLLPLCVYSQVNKENYQLLWEITGNHIEQPSYLFGSMHVMDNRVFEFSDSVLIALSNCEAFANEVHFDSMMLVVMETLMGNEDFLDSYANEEEAMDKESSNDDLSGMDDVADEDDYPTFLDAYLMNIAKRTGKKLYGLEDLRQQIDQLFQEEWKLGNDEESEEDFSRDSEEYQTMLRYYRSGDLGKIHDFMLPYDYENDEQLNARNVVMANSIGKITKKQTLFAVVGAAHLAGKNSVIALLKQRGYTLRPVTATFTGYAERFNPTFIDIPWDTIKDKKFGYQIEVPLEPFSFDFLEEETNAKAKVAMDFGTGLFYFITTAEVPGGSFLKNYLYKSAIESDEGGKVTQVDTIKRYGITGRAVTRYNKGEMMQYSKEQLFIYKNRLYQIRVAVTKKELLKSKSIERFFNSFQINKTKKKAAPKVTAEDREPRIVPNEKGAFSVKMQGKPKKRISKVRVDIEDLEDPVPYRLHILNYEDKSKNINQVVRYNDFPPGTILESDSAVFESIAEALASRKGDMELNSKDFIFNGYPAKEFSLIDDKKNLIVRMRVYLRGNRTYIVTGTAGSEEADKDFFNSFLFEPFQSIETEEFIAKDLYSIQLPSKRYEVEDSESYNYYNSEILNETLVGGYDANTGAIFFVSATEYSKYYELDNLDSVYQRIIEGYEDLEKIYTDKNIQINGYSGKEVIYKQNATNFIVKTRFVQVGNHYFEITAHLPLELVEDSTVNAIFDSFQLLDPKTLASINLFEAKSTLIIKDLSSTDSLTQARAKDALARYHEFKKEDLPLIYNALQRSYPNDTLEYGATKSYLLEQFLYTFDSTTVPFLKQFYHNINAEKYKEEILETLVTLKTESSINAFLELATLHNEKIEYEFSIYRGFSDSLKLFVKNYDDLATLAKNNKFQQAFLHAIVKVVKDSTINHSFIEKDLEAIYKMGAVAIQTAIDSAHTKNKYSRIYDVSVFTNLYATLPPSSQTITQFNQIIDGTGVNWLSLKAITYLADNQQPIKEEWILQFVADTALYYGLVENLQKINRLDLIPKKYLKHKSLAIAMLNYDIWQYEDDEYGVKAVVKDEVIIDYKGKSVKVYALQYEALDEDGVVTYYLAWAGPFPLNKKGTDFSNELTNYTYTEWNDNNYKQTIKKRIRSMLE